MKKSTKKFTGSIAALATVASIVAPSAVAIAAEKTAEELVTWAEQTKNFYDFNMALAKVMAMPVKSTEYYGLLARLQNIAQEVKTADVAAVLAALDSFGPNRDLTNFYNVFELVDQVKDEKNRLYLQNELNTWGKASVFTADVVAATDAIIKAWQTKTPEDVDAAEEAIANVKLSANKSWLNDQVYEVRKNVSFSVQRVSAKNANELQVRFTRPVDEATAKDLDNYVVTFNNVEYGVGYAHATSEIVKEVAVDGNVVTLKLTHDLDNGDKYSLDVKDGVLSDNLSTKVARYADTDHRFADLTAPKLLGASIDSTNHLVLEFDEPISYWPEELFDRGESRFAVTVDGKEIDFVDWTNVFNPTPNVLEYEATSNTALGSALRTVGVHEVVVYNARDRVNNNGNLGNKAPMLTTTYEVKAGQAPYVKSVDAVDYNSLKVNFSEPVTKAKIVVAKGETEFYSEVVELGSLYGAYEFELPSTALTDEEGTTKLYKDGDSQVKVSVSVTGYRDSDKLIGNAYNTTVTLKRDTDKPNVISKYNNKITTINETGALLIPFDRDDLTGLSASKVVVTDKNGVVRTANVTIADTTDALEVRVYRDKIKQNDFLTQGELEGMAPFTVEIGAGAVSVKTDLSYEGVFTSSLSNVAETTTVYADDSFEFKAKEAVEKVTIDNQNVITVTYKEKMSASAAKLANYTLDGKAMPTGTTLSMSGDSTIVRITLPTETYATNVEKKLVINDDVTTASGAYVVGDIATKEEYRSDLLKIRDNVRPTLVRAEYIVKNADKPSPTSFIKLTFSEDIAQFDEYDAKYLNDFSVVVNGVSQEVEAVYDYVPGDKYVTIALTGRVNPAQAATVKVTSNVDLTDEANPANKLAVGSNVATTRNIQAVAPADIPAEWLAY